MRYLVVIEKGPTSWGAHVPDLPGCVAVAETRAEVVALIREAIEFHIEGLGLRFLGAAEETTERISASPDVGSPLEGKYRKRVVPGFPYNIIYRVWEDYVYVVAVAHQHRRPGYWRERSNRR